MSDKDAPDTGTDEDGTPGDAGSAPDTGKPEPTNFKAEADRLAAEARKWENRSKANDARLKELEPLAKRAKELEDAGKSEIERLTEQLGHASRLAAEAEARVLQFEVAAEHKLTPAQAKWLRGATREELEANAAELLEAFRPAVEKEPEPEPEPSRSDNSRRRPTERLRPGAVPDADTEPEETDPRKLAAMVPRRFLS